MAYVDSSKLQDPNQQSQGQGQAQQTQSGPTISSGSSGDVVSGGGGASSPSSSAGQQAGSGGTQGGWTNIQSYVQANQGNPNNSAQALKSTVGNQFNQENQNLQNDVQAQKAAADKANSADFSQSSAAQAVNDYAQNGSADVLNKYQGILSGSYQKPQTPYAYGMDATTKNYGDDLSSNQGFGTLMNGIYNQAAGGQMSQGQFNLQNQLDTNNTDLANARSDLANQYSGLQSNIAAAPGQLNDYYKSQAQNYSQNQAALKQYLQTMAAQDQAQMNAPAQPKGNPVADQARNQYSAIQAFLGNPVPVATGAPKTGTAAPKPGDSINNGVAPALTTAQPDAGTTQMIGGQTYTQNPDGSWAISPQLDSYTSGGYGG